MVRRAARLATLVLLAGLTGCEPRLDPEQYGKVIYRLPQIKGADVPYPLPELDEPGAKSPAEASASEK